MTVRSRRCEAVLVAVALALVSAVAVADAGSLERARGQLAAGNAKQAFAELSALEGSMSGQPEFDYLLGVAALDSGRIDEAVIAFERVLAVLPNHAGAQMDLARAYYAAGSFDLAEAAFARLRASNPPPAAQQAISTYLRAISARRHQARAGWTGGAELGIGYDSNITGVPTDFGAAAQQAFNISGITATGNAIKRAAAYAHGALGAEYMRPISGGWSAFAGAEGRGRVYRRQSDFNAVAGDARFGAARHSGADQLRAAASYFVFNQEGDAPGDPKPTNDRRMGGVALEWRHALDPKTQAGLGVQLNAVRFPANRIEDFDQVFLTASWLKSFERAGVPLLYLGLFASDDRARNTFADGVTTKSKYLGGARGFLQYSLSPTLNLYNALAVIHRRDKDPYARSTEVRDGRDTYGEFTLGLGWQFRQRCALRLQWFYSTNRSNIDIYDFDRHEISSTIRCELS